MKDELIQYLKDQGFKQLSDTHHKKTQEKVKWLIEFDRDYLRIKENSLDVYYRRLLDLTTFRSLLKANGFVEWTFEGWLEKQGWKFDKEDENGSKRFTFKGLALWMHTDNTFELWYAKRSDVDTDLPIPQSEAAAIQLFQDYGIEVKGVGR